ARRSRSRPRGSRMGFIRVPPFSGGEGRDAAKTTLGPQPPYGLGASWIVLETQGKTAIKSQKDSGKRGSAKQSGTRQRPGKRCPQCGTPPPGPAALSAWQGTRPPEAAKCRPKPVTAHQGSKSPAHPR